MYVYILYCFYQSLSTTFNFYSTRNLQSMRVVNCWEIKDAGFRKCVTKLPHLEELDISLMELTHDSLEVLARSCPLLKSLKLTSYC